jgi:hypothetical protein
MEDQVPVRDHRSLRRGCVNLEDEAFTVVQMCVFPDGPAIDAWGIAYYSDDVVRGIDLAEVFRFDQQDVPDMFRS